MLRRIVIVLAGLAILAIPTVSLAKSDPSYIAEQMNEGAAKQWQVVPVPAPEPTPVVEPAPEPEPTVAAKPARKKSPKKKPAVKKRTCSAAEMLANSSNPCSSEPKPAKKKSGCENGLLPLGNTRVLQMGSEGCQSKPKPTSCASSMLGVATTSGKCK